MKALSSVLVLVLSVFAGSVNAASDQMTFNGKLYSFKGDRKSVKLCKSVIENDLKAVKRQLKRASSATAVKVTANSFYCNDVALPKFAAKVGSEEVAAFLKNS